MAYETAPIIGSLRLLGSGTSEETRTELHKLFKDYLTN